jgi:kexin
MKFVGQVGQLQEVYEFEIACADENFRQKKDSGIIETYDEFVDRLAGERRQYNRREVDSENNAVWESVQKKRRQYPRDTVDPMKYTNIAWHLSGTDSIPVHVIEAWKLGVFGNGTVIAIVDDGLDWHNVDLFPGYAPELSDDFNTNDKNDHNPTPGPGDSHGTSAAGVAAAHGYSGAPPRHPVCVHGVACRSRVAGLRLIAEAVSDATEARALSHKFKDIDIYSCSWGPQDDGTRLERPGPLTQMSISLGGKTGRKGLGNLYVWASGNGRDRGDCCAYDGYATHPNAITVAAVSHLGRIAYYSEACPSVFVCAPSSGDNWWITTTDTVGGGKSGCKDSFGGTSAATPFVAGVVAMIIEANPLLCANDVMSVLANTSTLIDATHKEWKLTAGGHMYSTYYGFGLVNAANAVRLARTMTPTRIDSHITIDTIGTKCSTVMSSSSLGEVSLSSPVDGGDRSLPCIVPESRGSRAAIVTWANVQFENSTENVVVEKVMATVKILHRRRGELSFTLSSPSGTRFTIPARPRDTGTDYDNWVFTFVGYRDELAKGKWSLLIIDTVSNKYTGDLQNFKLSITGTKI